MVKFCSECGAKAEYKFSPPKFCSSCGAPMGVAQVNESQPLDRSVQSSAKIVAINDSETDAEFVPKINKLEYEIDTLGSQYNHTIGSLGGKSPMSKRQSNTRDIDDPR